MMFPAAPDAAFPVLNSICPAVPTEDEVPVTMLTAPLFNPPLPVHRYKSPDRPRPPVPVATPLPTYTFPVFPAAAVPPENNKAPDAPVTASEDLTLTIPEEVVPPVAVMDTEPPTVPADRPDPDVNTMEPPDTPADVVGPPAMEIDPPVPEFVEPTMNATGPAAPPVAWPVDSVMVPAAPDALVPEWTNR